MDNTALSLKESVTGGADIGLPEFLRLCRPHEGADCVGVPSPLTTYKKVVDTTKK